MARFHGKVGYVETVESPPDSGVWVEEVTERSYTGDVLRDIVTRTQGEKINDDINVSARISIVADSFAYQNFSLIRYVHWLGAVWEITSIDANQRPRLVMSIGGLYNGPTP